MNTRWLFPVLALLFLGFYSCSTFKKVGNNLGDGIKGQADTIGFNLSSGVVEGFTNEAAKKKLNVLMDSLVQGAVSGLNTQLAEIPVDSIGIRLVGSLRDRLSDKAFRDSLSLLIADLLKATGSQGRQELELVLDRVIEKIGSEATTGSLSRIREELLGDKTAEALQVLMAKTLAGIASDSSAAALREQLIGSKTNIAITAIVDSAMMAVARRFNSEISPALNKDIGFLQKNAKELLLFLALLAIGIIAFVWYQRRRYLKMTTLISSQIYEMQNQESYDELTKRIKSKAIELGLEPQLRKLLKENGLSGEESWKNHQGKSSN